MGPRRTGLQGREPQGLFRRITGLLDPAVDQQHGSAQSSGVLRQGDSQRAGADNADIRSRLFSHVRHVARMRYRTYAGEWNG